MGHACYTTGQIKVTFGTGVFALVNVGAAVQSDHESGILSTVVWQFAEDKPVYNEIVIPASPDITTYGTGRFALIGSGLIKQLSDLPPAEEPKAIISPHKDITRLNQRFGEAVMRSCN